MQVGIIKHYNARNPVEGLLSHVRLDLDLSPDAEFQQVTPVLVYGMARSMPVTTYMLGLVKEDMRAA